MKRGLRLVPQNDFFVVFLKSIVHEFLFLSIDLFELTLAHSDRLCVGIESVRMRMSEADHVSLSKEGGSRTDLDVCPVCWLGCELWLRTPHIPFHCELPSIVSQSKLPTIPIRNHREQRINHKDTDQVRKGKGKIEMGETKKADRNHTPWKNAHQLPGVCRNE